MANHVPDEHVAAFLQHACPDWRMGGGPSGESVLAERFARGEIDEQEYRQRREVLRRKD